PLKAGPTMLPTHASPSRAEQRRRLLALLADGDVDAALQAGLMDYPADPADDADAPLRREQARLRTAWAARDRYRARQQRLARIAAARDTQGRARPAPAAGAAPAAPPLPPAAAAALARARARARAAGGDAT